MYLPDKNSDDSFAEYVTRVLSGDGFTTVSGGSNVVETGINSDGINITVRICLREELEMVLFEARCDIEITSENCTKVLLIANTLNDMCAYGKFVVIDNRKEIAFQVTASWNEEECELGRADVINGIHTACDGLVYYNIFFSLTAKSKEEIGGILKSLVLSPEDTTEYLH